MQEAVNDAQTREASLVVAADVESLQSLEDLARVAAAEDGVYGIKIGLSLALRFGLPRVVTVVNETCSLRVIYDHQKAGTDIPAIGTVFADALLYAGVDETIVFPHAGPATLRSFAQAALDREIDIFVGLAMSHERYFVSEGGFISDESPLHILRVARSLGVRRFVLPATKLGLVQRLSGEFGDDPVEILTPGIGLQGGSIAATKSAIRPHRCLPVVGSAIYRAADPRAALRGFINELAVQ